MPSPHSRPENAELITPTAGTLSNNAEDELETVEQKRRKTIQACLACRAIKVRCLNSDTDGQCLRCLNKGLECTYQSHKRGRKPKNRPADEPPPVETKRPTLYTSVHASRAQAEMMASSVAVGADLRRAHSSASPSKTQHEEPPPPNAYRYHTFAGDMPVDGPSLDASTTLLGLSNYPSSAGFSQALPPPYLANAQAQASSTGIRTSDSPDSRRKASTPDRSPLATAGAGTHLESDPQPRPKDYSVAGRLQSPTRFDNPHPQASHKSDRVDANAEHSYVAVTRDPVSLGYISEDYAMSLFSCYFSQLNIYIAVLDENLHTPRYVRERSSLLYTAILSVSANFVQPDLAGPIVTLAQDLLKEAMVQDACSIELVQAISILTFWKSPSDPTSWRRIGYAVRVALELDLYIFRPRPLPSEELEAREVLNLERTWIQIYCFDWTISGQYLKPSMVPPEYIPDATAWALGHPSCRAAGDAMLACSVEGTKFISAYRSLRKFISNGIHTERVLESIRREHANWSLRWLGPAPPLVLNQSQKSVVKFYDLEAELLWAELQAEIPVTSLNASVINAQHQQTVVEKALAVGQWALETFMNTGTIRITQDIITFGVAVASLALTRRYDSVNAATQGAIRTLFESMALASGRAARSDAEVSAYLKRFLEHLFRKISGLSSRISSPKPGAGVSGEVPAEPSGAGALFNMSDNVYWNSVWSEFVDLCNASNPPFASTTLRPS